MWEVLLSPQGGTKQEKQPITVVIITSIAHWGAFENILPPPYLEGKLRKPSTHIASSCA